jgi:hypothetical protein
MEGGEFFQTICTVATAREYSGSNIKVGTQTAQRRKGLNAEEEKRRRKERREERKEESTGKREDEEIALAGDDDGEEAAVGRNGEIAESKTV